MKNDTSIGRVIGVGAVLIALWGLSLGLSYVSLGAWALPVAIAIATVKAALVLWSFMELSRERTSAVFAFAVGVLMFSLLMAFVVADVLTRAPPPSLPG